MYTVGRLPEGISSNAMRYDQKKHHRRSTRLHDYDYTQAGAYFVTICTMGRVCMLGDIVNGCMQLNTYGQIVAECWSAIPGHIIGVQLDEFVIMPNHIHGILVLLDDSRGTACRAPTTERFGRPVSGSLATIVRSFKSATTKLINQTRNNAGQPVWQRSYYEHVVRDDEQLDRIRQYILDNPAKWSEDIENPQNIGKPNR